VKLFIASYIKLTNALSFLSLFHEKNMLIIYYFIVSPFPFISWKTHWGRLQNAWFESEARMTRELLCVIISFYHNGPESNKKDGTRLSKTVCRKRMK